MVDGVVFGDVGIEEHVVAEARTTSWRTATRKASVSPPASCEMSSATLAEAAEVRMMTVGEDVLVTSVSVVVTNCPPGPMKLNWNLIGFELGFETLIETLARLVHRTGPGLTISPDD